jgi:hypothetical protein
LDANTASIDHGATAWYTIHHIDITVYGATDTIIYYTIIKQNAAIATY